MSKTKPTGVLLINLGTPDSPSVADVRRYLREFLSDPRVIDINPVGRWLLLNLIILPLRPRKSAAAYREIWTPAGSPLLVHSEQLAQQLQQVFGDDASVRLAMRYGSPSIDAALEAFERDGIDRVVVVPLSPQYASATAGSALQATFEKVGARYNVPEIQVVGEFYDDPGYISAAAKLAEAATKDADHILISFHGLPERQIRNADMTRSHCLVTATCCESLTEKNRRCYRAQCHATARLLAASLALPDDRWSITFQSRFGRDPWIQPFTDIKLEQLAADGVNRVAIITPGFTADCLETLEELGLRGKEDFLEAGGESLALAPCLNDDAAWAEALAQIIRRGSAWLQR